MDAQQFLAEFGYIANAPGGVDRLRDMILELAIQGRLISSNEKRESTLDLLSEIRQWRSTLNSSKRGRRGINDHPISGREKVLPIPDHWVWVRHSDIFSLAKGKNPKDLGVSGKYPYLDIEALDRGNVQRYTNDEQAPRATRANILVVCDGSRSGLILDGRDGVIGSTLARVDTFPPIQPFVKLLFQHSYRRLNAEKKGAAIPHLDTARLLAGACGLPPLSDQKDIVAKVYELMTLCDQLEAQQQDRRKLQNALRQSTLQALASAQSPHELQDSWQRLQTNFGSLFSEPEDVRDFKGLILDLAVSGLLLPTSGTTTSTADLIEQIANARTEWAKTAEEQEKKEAVAMLKKLRTQQVAVPSSPLPEHWRWASLLQVAQAVVDCHNKTAPYVAEGIHLVRTTDIRDGQMDLSKTKKISEETYNYWARRMPPKSGDIFFTREAPMGEAAIVPAEGGRVCLGQRTMLIRLFPELFSNRYLLYVIQSPSFQSRMTEAAVGMAVKHLRVGGVEDLVVPVPPRAEQDQIVGIVDSLFELCDRHAEYLATSRRVATNLSSAAVAALTGITLEQEEEAPVKVPQTELITSLRLGSTPDVKAQAPLATLLARHNGEMSARDLWQRFGGEIDAFYAQLKTEVAHGWIAEPAVAEVREKPTEAAGA